MIYQDFAGVYDRFMAGIPYDRWLDRLEEIWRAHGQSPRLVLDLACGTGGCTTRLAARGYEMIGVDASAGMLAEARAKPESDGILYLCQDMRRFELYGTVDAVLCLCDGLNYLTRREDLLAVFRLVNNYLNPGGLFVFDLKTEAYFQSLGDQVFADALPDAAYIWENRYQPRTRTNRSDITLFTAAGSGLYRRGGESHRQKAYAPAAVEKLLTAAGLRFLRHIADAEPERDYFVAREWGKKTEDT